MTIGIITVTFNSQNTIRRTLESICRQSIHPHEVLIIDGASSDKTLNIVKEYKSSLPIRILSEEDDGIYDAMNKGIKNSRSDIIGFLNSDDEFSDDEVIARIHSEFSRNKNLKIFVSGVDYLNSDGSLSRKWRLNGIKPFRSGWHPPHPGFYTLRKILLELNGFNQCYEIAADFDLMLRAFENVDNENVAVHTDKVVNMYLGGASNAKISSILKGNREILHSFKSLNIRVTYTYTVKRIIKKFLSKWR